MLESALSVWRTYPYLWGALLYCGIALLGFRIFPRGTRHLVILSGLMSLLAAPFCYFLEGSYWMPKRLGGYRLGLEDFLISFSVAALAWFLAAWPFRHRLRFDTEHGSSWRRLALVSVPTVGFYLLLVFAHLDPMTSLIANLVVAGGGLLLLRPGLWPLSLAGFLLYPPFYYLMVKFCYWLWPESVHQWNLNGYWGRLVGGLPLGEIIWAMVYSLSWPMYVGYVFQVMPLGAATAADEAGRGDPLPQPTQSGQR